MSAPVEHVSALVREAVLDVAGVDILEWGSEKVTRAAIKGMSEPTDAMINAGQAACPSNEYHAGAIWSAMIEVALAEAPA